MQDRFKFRFFNKIANKMVLPINCANVDCIYECLAQQVCYDEDIQPLPYNHMGNGIVFMQCTGLKDKNGKLIYEGDVVRIFHVSGTMQGKLFTDVVEWNELRCRFDTEKYGVFDEDDIYEVIGNVYQNPELLED